MPAQASSSVPFILLFTAIGFIVGALVAYLVMLNEKRKTPESSETDVLKERLNRFQEIAGLWRERSGGKLAVWLNDKMVSDARSLDAAQRQQLESAGRELIDWMGGTPAPVQRPPEPAAPAAGLSLPPVEAASRLTQTPPVIPAVVAAAPPIPSNKPVSIVEQVNEILKELVAGTPMEARGIRLAEDPRAGVVVWVGIDHYNGVDSVPDSEVKAILKQAGAEWERRTDKLRH